jgi:hypothetical protein
MFVQERADLTFHGFRCRRRWFGLLIAGVGGVRDFPP